MAVRMTLYRRLTLGVSILFFLLLAGVEAIYVVNARAELRNKLAAQAQDAATVLALRLALVPDLGDTVLVETILNPIFDRGYFREIVVTKPDGEVLVRKSLPASEAGVPQWFVRLLPLDPPGAQSLISNGWRQMGRVVAFGHPYFAYQELWRIGLQTLAWLAAGYALALAAAAAFLAMVLRPLRQMEQVATAIGERQFRVIDPVPSARELARVVLAMNSMSEKLRSFVTEESERAEGLRREVFMDPVTAVYNRRGFEQQLQALLHSRADAHAGLLALFQIEGFGEFNTRVGFRRGDDALALLAAALTRTSEGRVAVWGRLGGAGFALAAVNLGSADARELLGAGCAALAQVLKEQGLDGELQFHCGAAHFEGPAPAYSALLATADHAVEGARATGSNGFVLEEFDAARSEGSQAWRARIEKVLEEDRIALFSQDVLALDGSPLHAEITVRMLDEDGAVPAAQFLPMATRHGLIPRIDCRILEKALGLMDAGCAPVVPMALNLSARTLADPAAAARLLALLDADRSKARRLVFEMTEFGALQDWRQSLRFSEELRLRGAGFALDNFSMLQESLMLVHALRPAYIKLSPVYSRDIAQNADCRFLVQSIVRVAQTLEIAVYAQAVEDTALLPELAKLGITGYQGYAAARPARIS